MVLLVGFVSGVAGLLLWAYAIRKGKADLDRGGPTERANAERFDKILFLCGAILGAVGLLLIMLRFILRNFGVPLD